MSCQECPHSSSCFRAAVGISLTDGSPYISHPSLASVLHPAWQYILQMADFRREAAKGERTGARRDIRFALAFAASARESAIWWMDCPRMVDIIHLPLFRMAFCNQAP